MYILYPTEQRAAAVQEHKRARLRRHKKLIDSMFLSLFSLDRCCDDDDDDSSQTKNNNSEQSESSIERSQVTGKKVEKPIIGKITIFTLAQLNLACEDLTGLTVFEAV